VTTELEMKAMLGAYGRQLEYARRAARLSGLIAPSGLPADLDHGCDAHGCGFDDPTEALPSARRATTGEAQGEWIGPDGRRLNPSPAVDAGAPQDALPEDPTARVRAARFARRRSMVERVSREIVENLVFAENKSELVEEILQTLYEEVGRTVTFSYCLPDMDVRLDVRIFARGANGDKEVSAIERDDILKRLWRITLAKVDETML
jgi:hypothetical protein